jgi:hypothetical protein
LYDSLRVSFKLPPESALVTVVFVPAWGMIFSTQAVREKKETIKIKQA